jgi:hypothetical protein
MIQTFTNSYNEPKEPEPQDIYNLIISSILNVSFVFAALFDGFTGVDYNEPSQYFSNPENAMPLAKSYQILGIGKLFVLIILMAILNFQNRANVGSVRTIATLQSNPPSENILITLLIALSLQTYTLINFCLQDYFGMYRRDFFWYRLYQVIGNIMIIVSLFIPTNCWYTFEDKSGSSRPVEKKIILSKAEWYIDLIGWILYYLGIIWNLVIVLICFFGLAHYPKSFYEDLYSCDDYSQSICKANLRIMIPMSILVFINALLIIIHMCCTFCSKARFKSWLLAMELSFLVFSYILVEYSILMYSFAPAYDKKLT